MLNETDDALAFLSFRPQCVQWYLIQCFRSFRILDASQNWKLQLSEMKCDISAGKPKLKAQHKLCDDFIYYSNDISLATNNCSPCFI